MNEFVTRLHVVLVKRFFRFGILVAGAVACNLGSGDLVAGCHDWTDLRHGGGCTSGGCRTSSQAGTGSCDRCGGQEEDCPSCDGVPCDRCGRHHHGHCWNFPLLRALIRCIDSAEAGCGEVYWGPYHNDPPDRCEPCDRGGNWVGQAGPYRAPYRSSPYQTSYDVPGDAYDEYESYDEAAPSFPQITPDDVESPEVEPIRSTRRRRRRPARRW